MFQPQASTVPVELSASPWYRPPATAVAVTAGEAAAAAPIGAADRVAAQAVPARRIGEPADRTEDSSSTASATAAPTVVPPLDPDRLTVDLLSPCPAPTSRCICLVSGGIGVTVAPLVLNTLNRALTIMPVPRLHLFQAE